MKASSTTLVIPETSSLPQHVAVIMDGNGRWATSRLLPRAAGHLKGLSNVRKIVRYCAEHGIKYLTLFSFSSENWRRPEDEVNLLMRLFTKVLTKEVAKLNEHNIHLRVIGDLSGFNDAIKDLIQKAEEATQDNDYMYLTIAANYGGRWDILQAMQQQFLEQTNKANDLTELRQHLSHVIEEIDFSPFLSMAWAPEPDLFIRTGGEQRISNFLIWQLAYTELYFTNIYWPDFDAKQMDEALHWYASRERRFGRTSAQVQSK